MHGAPLRAVQGLLALLEIGEPGVGFGLDGRHPMPDGGWRMADGGVSLPTLADALGRRQSGEGLAAASVYRC